MESETITKLREAEEAGRQKLEGVRERIEKEEERERLLFEERERTLRSSYEDRITRIPEETAGEAAQIERAELAEHEKEIKEMRERANRNMKRAVKAILDRIR